MSTYVSLTGGAGPAVASAMRLKGLADDLDAQAKSILSEIKAIEHGHPWGDDDAGKQFLAQYNQQAPGDSTPYSEALRQQLSSAGLLLGELSDAILDAVASIDSVDADNAEGMNK